MQTYRSPIISAPSTILAGCHRRVPEDWGPEEAMLRSGVICGGSGGDGSGNMLKTALGGSHVARRLRQYVADRHNMGGGSTCNKAQRSNIQLIPGLMLFWCLCCRRCVLFAIMPDAESPRTVFDLLYTHFAEPPELFQLDNGCHLHAFITAREPAHFADMRVLIDQTHYKGHVECSEGYNTGVLFVGSQ